MHNRRIPNSIGAVLSKNVWVRLLIYGKPLTVFNSRHFSHDVQVIEFSYGKVLILSSSRIVTDFICKYDWINLIGSIQIFVWSKQLKNSKPLSHSSWTSKRIDLTCMIQPQTSTAATTVYTSTWPLETQKSIARSVLNLLHVGFG